jgi:anti-anti-sigma factor
MIRALIEPPVLTVDVQGPASMMESPTVQTLASAEVAKGVRAVRVDLRDCTAMDSTFSGMLLVLKRMLDAVEGELTLVSPSTTVLEVLGQMGLEDFYRIELAERAPGAWRDIVAAQPDVDQLRQLVLDAHDELAKRHGPASDAFREVVRELRGAPASGSA